MDAYIISSNIRFSTTDDGAHAWPARKELLAKLYLKYSPLVIGTQEGREPQLRELQALLPGYKLADEHRGWLAERMYPCIFYNSSLLRLLKSGDFWLSLTPEVDGSSSFESMFPRLCSWVCVALGEKKFFVFNTHLDHVLSSTREAQIGVLCQQMKIINSENLPMILLGDFNDAPSSETRKIIHKHFPKLRDDWRGPEEASHHPFTGTNPEGQRIDWLLHDLEERAEIFLSKESVGGIWPSDHFPLIARIRA